MSRYKRPADSTLDDHNASDDDASDGTASPHQESSSQPGSDGRKRRRISDGSDTTPDDTHSHATHMTEDDPSDNDSDDASDDTDTDAEATATQAMRARKARDRQSGNVARESGVLESVEIFDFMCHHYYHFKLGPLINFVCGRNGSGKSAILTAIILCLGAKASATNRGANLKRLIKEGADQARIICRIKNQGEFAYMPDDYGDSISIERYFSRAGSSGYKIRAERGRQVSTKRSELDAILDHFALQIDNPLNVLSQDMARSFISSSNPAEKYKFFIKGVQLEQLDQDYNLIGEQLNNIAVKLERKEEDVASLETTMKHKKQAYDLAKRRDGLKDKVRDTRRQLVWIQVREQERIVEKHLDNLKDAELKITTAQALVRDLDASFQRADTAHEATKTALDEADATLKRAEEEKLELKAHYDTAKAEYMNAQAEVRTVRDSVQSHAKTIKDQEEAVADEEQRLVEINGGGAARRLQDLEAARSVADQAKTEWDTQKAAKADLERTINQGRIRQQEKLLERDARQTDVDNQTQKIKDMQASKDRQMSAFKPNTDKLERFISQESRWKHKPIGPIGRYVQLTRPEWSSILERMFGGTLAGFITFCKEDSNLLIDLKKRAACDADIFIINQHPIVPIEPDEQFDTVLRVLDIQNEYVKKHLILQHTIEQAILIPNVDNATSAMYDGGRLHHVKVCFAMHPHDKQKGILFKYTASGEPSQDPVAPWTTLPRMKTDLEAALAARQQVLEEYQDKLVEAKAAWQNARAEVVKAEQALTRHKYRERDLKIASQKADDNVQALEDAIKDDHVESGKLDALRESLQESKDSKLLAEEQYKDAVIASDIKKAQMRERNQKLSDFDIGLLGCQKNFADAKVAHRQTDRLRAQTLGDKNNAISRVEDAQSDKQSMIEKSTSAQELRDSLTAQAEGSVGARVNIPDDATREALDLKYRKLQDDYRRYQRDLGFSLEEAAEATNKATNAYKQALKDYKDLKEVDELLHKSLAERKLRWQKFRHHITARARITFSYLLSERGFRGTLLMNHKKHLLDLAIEPDLTRRNGTGRNAKTLSGGEKSFSQICLLLAMWEAMGSPIRCLDEFDVFMDAVNRNSSVKMIIEAARDSVGRQYVLISPGTKNDIQRAPDVAVTDLGAPQRAKDDSGQQQTIEETGRR